MEVEASQSVGFRSFREAGGMAPSPLSRSSKPPSGWNLAVAERAEIACLWVQRHGVRDVACRVGRAASTISRELRRNAATRGGNVDYRATTARWRAERAARHSKRARAAANETLRTRVQDRPASAAIAPDGTAAPGPAMPWKRRRQDRRRGMAWSPRQIAERLGPAWPNDKTMHISQNAIYQALLADGRPITGSRPIPFL